MPRFVMSGVWYRHFQKAVGGLDVFTSVVIIAVWCWKFIRFYPSAE
jgi:hypothetical protein